MILLLQISPECRGLKKYQIFCLFFLLSLSDFVNRFQCKIQFQKSKSPIEPLIPSQRKIVQIMPSETDVVPWDGIQLGWIGSLNGGMLITR